MKAALPLKVGDEYIRKRDKARVRIERMTRIRVVYCTLPMLIIWDTTPAAFRRNFRLPGDQDG